MLTVLQVCKENIAIVSMLPAMVKTMNDLEVIIKNIMELINKQQTPITIHAKANREVRFQLCSHLIKLLPPVRSLAHLQNNSVLFAQVDYTFSDLFRSKSHQLVATAGAISLSLEANPGFLKEVNIKKEQLLTLRNLVSRFDELAVAPHVALNSRIAATKGLSDKLKTADTIIKEQLDGLLLALNQYPHFHKTYFRARRQITYGRPKQVLKNKIKQYHAAPEIPRKYLKHASKFKLIPIIISEVELVPLENPQL